MSHTYTILLSSTPPWLSESNYPSIKELAEDNLFCGFLSVLIYALCDWCATMLKLNNKKVTIAVTVLLISLLFLKSISLRGDIAIASIIKQAMPFLSVIAWSLSVYYYRQRTQINQKNEINNALNYISKLEKKFSTTGQEQSEQNREQLVQISTLSNRIEKIDQQLSNIYDELKKVRIPSYMYEGYIIQGNGDRYYKVENGKRRWFVSHTIFEQRGFSDSDVLRLSEVIVEQIPLGEPIS